MATTVFSLKGRGLKLDTADDVKECIGDLSSPNKHGAITEVLLQGNTIGVDAAKALAPHLSNAHALQHADLSDIFTSRLLSEIPPALDALLTALLPLHNLHTINLSDNAFGLNTQAPLVHFLERHVPLRHLILNNNGLGPEAGTLVADALTKLASAKKQEGNVPPLETIVCGRNRLENKSMVAWARAVAAHAAGLREVKIIQNGIRQEGIQVLLKHGLSSAKALRVLDLQDNTFTISGAQALGEVIGQWQELRELGVGDCLLSARGTVILCQALSRGENKNLEVLRLQYNETDAQGVQAIAEAAKEALPKLRKVELNGNRFSEEDPAVEALRELLHNRKTKEAEIPGNIRDEDWGLDDLSDLEDDDEDEERGGSEPDEEEEEVAEKAERDLKHAAEAEDENVALEEDDSVDELANRLGKTDI